MKGDERKMAKEGGKWGGGKRGGGVGKEGRRESNELSPYAGLGDFTGLSITQYGGKRNIYATYAEVALPVIKQLELNGALRYDHYTAAGDSVTPTVGIKYRPVRKLALPGR